MELIQTIEDEHIRPTAINTLREPQHELQGG
uniref:Uncharacterized protein n=1 Tax=Myoviridae sp. ctBtT5 TaxID=2825048 RepID=A0A8S5PY69_9CAUD|nr:MAG TPA: hypothetical protein [Myoviridae sp. ctBtT5]